MVKLIINGDNRDWNPSAVNKNPSDIYTTVKLKRLHSAFYMAKNGPALKKNKTQNGMKLVISADDYCFSFFDCVCKSVQINLISRATERKRHQMIDRQQKRVNLATCPVWLLFLLRTRFDLIRFIIEAKSCKYCAPFHSFMHSFVLAECLFVFCFVFVESF